MTIQDLVSSAPGVFEGFASVISTACAAQNPIVSFFPFELGQYEPATYVLLHGIENHQWVIEDTIYGHQEHYDIVGSVIVFTGTGVADSPAVTTTVMNTAYSTFQACVMQQFVANKNEPIMGFSGSSNGPYQTFAGYTRYTASVGHTANGEPWGWEGVIDFSFHFDAYIYVSAS